MKHIFLIAFFAFSIYSQAQETVNLQQRTFTLEEAIQFGLENGYNSRIAKKDVAIALKQKWEIIAQGLPQISGDANYNNNLKQPVTLIPGEVAGGEPGTFVPVTFGTKHSVNATGTWNQLIFDGSYIVGIQSAKTLLQISENAKVKTDLEVKKAITDAYGNVLLASESVTILKKNLSTVEKNLNDTRKIFENGLAEEEDVEQLEITRLNLEANLNNSIRMQSIAYDMLKVTMGIPVTEEIKVTDNLSELSEENFNLLLLSKEMNVEENIDYRIAEDQANLSEVEVKLEKSKALPTLSAFVNYGVAGYSDEFTFFNSDQDYFTQSVLGVNLSIPIFSSGMRSAKTAQKQLAFEQAKLQLEQTKNQVTLEIANARNEYQFALENYENKQRNLELAERIEKKNSIKFFEGIATSFELSEAQQQLFQAQQDYLQSMLDVISTKAELENLLDTTKYPENKDE
ncbi:TolC family protein [Marixanthomonas sp. SCSIO 43207]|uniref:TolC family protein n=1 Tax=Marixanthomonas sp. SCSIO 43207 TaxID=2779360 RepID=UPI001CA98686|nr:TolC family protein [Marixanthomonas sp. SCSIO 43207]UAB81732.1 TolC family protein [Marixanthomonas sp. SCSIO 43207]